MRTGPIQQFPREETVSREETVFPSTWLKLASLSADFESRKWFSHKNQPEVTKAETVLIMLEKASSSTEQLIQYAKSGARVYVLAPEIWKPETRLRKYNNVFIRRMPSVPVSGIYSMNHSKILLNETIQQEDLTWHLRLDPEQSEAFRHMFLRLFWHEATDEAFLDKENFSFKKVKERPFEIPILDPNAVIQEVDPDTLIVPQQDGILLVREELPPVDPVQQLYIKPKKVSYKELTSWKEQGTKVVWEESFLPECSTDGSEGELLLSGYSSRLHITLNQEQAAELYDILDVSVPWFFETDLGIDSQAAETEWLLENETTSREIIKEQSIPLGEAKAPTLQQAEATKPEYFTEPDPLALTVRYDWMVTLPQLPSSAKEDPLIDAWKKIDTIWAEELKKLSDRLLRVELGRERIKKMFSRFLRVIGFFRTHKELHEKIADLKAEIPSQEGPEGASKLFDRLVAAEKRIVKLVGDQTEAEKKAREDEEREKQQNKWKKRVLEAKKKLPRKKEELKTKEEELKKTIKELSEIERSLSAIEKTLQNLGNEIQKKKLGLQNIEKQKSELDRMLKTLGNEFQRKEKEVQNLKKKIQQNKRQIELQTATKKSRRKNRKRNQTQKPLEVSEIEKEILTLENTIQDKKTEIQYVKKEKFEFELQIEISNEKIENFEDEKRKIKREKNDFLAKKKKLLDEKSRSNREINRLKVEIPSIEEQTKEKFVFRLPKDLYKVLYNYRQNGRKKSNGKNKKKQAFIPELSSSSGSTIPKPELPKEALPEIGRLYHVKSNKRKKPSLRYLVIDHWEELETSLHIAERLNATQVSPEEEK